MTDQLSDPLTPPECDLRGQAWMPLYGDRLLNSDFDARASDAEFRAAITLWWKSWTQVPAASLPDDDVILCKLAGLGRDIKTWKALRAGNVLHGYVKCSDGRLYHALLAEEAVLSYERRLKSAKKRDADNKRLEEWRARRAKKLAEDALRNASGNDNETPDETRFETHEIPNETQYEISKTRPDLTRPDQYKEREAIASPKKAAAEVRGCRLSPDWQLSPDDRAYANQLGLDPERVSEDFREYWLAKTGANATKRDWSLTWRGWCRRQAERPRINHPQRVDTPFGAYAPVETWTRLPINAALGTDTDAGHAIVGGYHIDWCAQELLEIAQLPDTPRSDWPVLAAWLRDGIAFHETIAPVIRRIAARPAYEPPGSLKFFDKAVREARAA